MMVSVPTELANAIAVILMIVAVACLFSTVCAAITGATASLRRDRWKYLELSVVLGAATIISAVLAIGVGNSVHGY